MKPPAALVFDVDGTLAETEELHRKAFNASFREAGLDWRWGPALYRELLSQAGGKERIAWHIDRSGLEPRAELLARIPALHARKTQIYAEDVARGRLALRPGIAGLVDAAALRGVRLAIATTTSLANVEALLAARFDRVRAGRFEVIVAGDMVERKKPAPDVYAEVLDRLDLRADAAVAIEDSRNGVRAARAAGVAVIATPSLYCAQDDLSEADLCVPDATAIPAVFGWIANAGAPDRSRGGRRRSRPT